MQSKAFPSKKNTTYFFLHYVTELFLFQEQIVTRTNYLDILRLFAVPKMVHSQPNVFFYHDGTSPHWGLSKGFSASNFSKPMDWTEVTNLMVPSLT
jgi:hypothetical protein